MGTFPGTITLEDETRVAHMKSSVLSILAATLAALTMAGAALAQQSPTPPSELATRSTPSEAPGEDHERILGVIPEFGVTNRRQAPSLTSSQKFRLFARQAFDPFQWVVAGAQAGLSQAENTFPGYGQGAAGYGKRYGATVADVTDREFMSNFAFPVLLKQDPRYFRIGHGTIKHRIIYSLAQEFSCKSDEGARQFNFSKMLGAFASKTISNAYYPPDGRGFRLTMRRSGVSILSGMGNGLAAEFWPDINCKVFHKCGEI